MSEGFNENNANDLQLPTQPVTPTPTPSKPKFNLKDFLDFNTMVTPAFIKWYYIIGSVLAALSVFVFAVTVMMIGGFMVFAGLLVMLVGIPVALVLFRVSCELMAVIFSIHKELKRIK
ncbi:MAG: DUF4282 domain-containing protein [Defluviitaleaceae bacterium]|nr:DUF4282 domain-containing protein [Defluviitaleaceae bacterium]